ncbi:MAG: Gfo/Idh/MocA family oxidoreductase, partial [Acidobacteriota bacterium]
AGCFSSDPEKSRLSGEDFFLSPDRVYATYQEMAEKEAQRADKIDFVSIVVQNHLHFPVAKAFLEAGFHVICDKPLTHDYELALELREIVRKSGQIFVLTHNYTGYPMVKEARRMVKDGELGRILKIVAEYPQGYAVGDVEGDGQGKINNWRSDPKIALLWSNFTAK